MSVQLAARLLHSGIDSVSTSRGWSPCCPTDDHQLHHRAPQVLRENVHAQQRGEQRMRSQQHARRQRRQHQQWWRQGEHPVIIVGTLLLAIARLVLPPSMSHAPPLFASPLPAAAARPPQNDRIFTTGEVGWAGVPHLEGRMGKTKDYSAVISKALVRRQTRARVHADVEPLAAVCCPLACGQHARMHACMYACAKPAACC